MFIWKCDAMGRRISCSLEWVMLEKIKNISLDRLATIGTVLGAVILTGSCSWSEPSPQIQSPIEGIYVPTKY